MVISRRHIEVSLASLAISAALAMGKPAPQVRAETLDCYWPADLGDPPDGVDAVEDGHGGLQPSGGWACWPHDDPRGIDAAAGGATGPIEVQTTAAAEVRAQSLDCYWPADFGDPPESPTPGLQPPSGGWVCWPHDDPRGIEAAAGGAIGPHEVQIARRIFPSIFASATPTATPAPTSVGNEHWWLTPSSAWVITETGEGYSCTESSPLVKVGDTCPWGGPFEVLHSLDGKWTLPSEPGDCSDTSMSQPDDSFNQTGDTVSDDYDLGACGINHITWKFTRRGETLDVIETERLVSRSGDLIYGAQQHYSARLLKPGEPTPTPEPVPSP